MLTDQLTNNVRIVARAYNPNTTTLTNTASLPGPPISSLGQSRRRHLCSQRGLAADHRDMYHRPAPAGQHDDDDNFEYVEVKKHRRHPTQRESLPDPAGG